MPLAGRILLLLMLTQAAQRGLHDEKHPCWLVLGVTDSPLANCKAKQATVKHHVGMMVQVYYVCTMCILCVQNVCTVCVLCEYNVRTVCALCVL